MRSISPICHIVTHIPHPDWQHQTTTGTFQVHAHTAHPTHTSRVNYSASPKQINNSQLGAWQSKLFMMLLPQLVFDHTNTCVPCVISTFWPLFLAISSICLKLEGQTATIRLSQCPPHVIAWPWAIVPPPSVPHPLFSKLPALWSWITNCSCPVTYSESCLPTTLMNEWVTELIWEARTLICLTDRLIKAHGWKCGGKSFE